jgi:hypothetical protein
VLFNDSDADSNMTVCNWLNEIKNLLATKQLYENSAVQHVADFLDIDWLMKILFFSQTRSCAWEVQCGIFDIITEIVFKRHKELNIQLSKYKVF